MKTFISLFAVIATMCATAGCGYHLADSSYLQDEVSRVGVRIFENHSSESGAGISFTDELIREVTEKSITRVVDPADAGWVISGTIQAITFATLSRSSTEDVTERKVTARVDVALLRPGGEVVWSVKDFQADESYTVASDTIDDEANKAEAVDTIAERVAERLVSQMMSNF